MPGPIPMHAAETFTHVLAQNQADPPERQVRFRCRTLTGLERHEISDLVYGLLDPDLPGLERIAAIKRAARECVLVALEGWENWKGPDEKSIPFPAVRRALLAMLHPDDVTEIGTEIAQRSGLWASARTEAAHSD